MKEESTTATTTILPVLPPFSKPSELKILVTGNAGFIGSHLSEYLLKRGNTIIGVDEINDYYDVNQKEHNLSIQEELSKRLSIGSAANNTNGTITATIVSQRFRFYQVDICNMSILEKIFATEKPDVVCHLAARAGVRPSLEDPFLYLQTNVQGTMTLLELSRKHGVKNFVYASSSSVYGNNTKIPFSESDPVDSPVSPYAATKRSCELMAATYHNLYKLPVTGLRFFTVYGPRGRPDMAPFKFVDRIYKGQIIEKYGDGTSCRDYTYIDDIILGIVKSIDNPHPCEVINLGNSQVVSLNEFISVIEECVGKKAKIKNLPDQLGDVPLTYADCTKAKSLLGYQPTWDIRKGMKSFVSWYLEYQLLSDGQTPSCSSGSDSD